MNVYLARQPIVDRNKNTVAYEILYRDDSENIYKQSCNIDGSEDTKKLIYNVMLEFGFNNITNGKKAFFNFTDKLLFTDLPFLLDKDKIVIELLENIEYNNLIIKKIEELKLNKFCFAIDDYVGDNLPERVINSIDIIKVDFLNLSIENRKLIAQKYSKKKILLAEKIENDIDMKQALEFGYDLFQGYFFSKPTLHIKKSFDISSATYIKLLNEISKGSNNLDNFIKIIETDANATYRFLCKANTLKYFYRSRVESIKQALMFMGIEEVKRWILLILLKDISEVDYEESINIALIRAVFSERIVNYIGLEEYSSKVYMVGLFSIIEEFSREIIYEIFLKFPSMNYISEALSGKNEFLTDILDFVIAYECKEEKIINDFIEKYKLNYDRILSLYLDSLKYAYDQLSI